MARWAILAALVLAAGAVAQERPNAVLLIAAPELADPNFRETVVLVTQAPDASTVGVILNRPGFGGPVMPGVKIALFRSEDPPQAPAFHVLQGIWLTMHPRNIEPLLAGPQARYRLYSGFSGWAPGQLEAEIQRDSWYVLPATADVLFRQDTSRLWRELVEKARKANAPRAGASGGAILARCKPCVSFSLSH